MGIEFDGTRLKAGDLGDGVSEGVLGDGVSEGASGSDGVRKAVL